MAPKFQPRITPVYGEPPSKGVPEIARSLLVDRVLDSQDLVAQIETGVRDAIISGALARGEQLPAGSNPDWVTLAYRNLEAQGILYLERTRVASSEGRWIVL
ncbi:MAG: hypothetical protein DLM68_02500 [Hyphomicrobiales bacterium]|nr:MAG: hypothetical protein DLM68_02500 [Hyphomicrobiales bacterium]